MPFFIVALTLLGCRKVEPAPEDLDGLVHFSWEHLDDASPDALIDAVEKIHAAVGGDSFTDNIEGSVTHLDKEAVAQFGRSVEPSEATGVMLIDRVDCTPEELAAVVGYDDQMALYTGVYDTYERSDNDGVAAFLDGSTDTVGWDLTYKSGILGVKYTVNSRTVMRRVRDTAFGTAILIRAHMRAPAVFENEDSNNYLLQDYHLEIYWPHEDQLLHLYGLWKDIRLLGFEDEEEGTQRLILNNLADWDEGTSSICATGLP